ncbi:TonB C-terminal domain-containing protein [uncultured Campylobacter sp.]|uniref:TonB C-terminal domain-containing protein n=1 Tax=uncultured Campylobacter sp. TaxID=218934 RepID=UPI00262E1829|nr:TonB C-terminal domain-containing protein [uncultured Campylobacter sp.]
MANYSNFTGVKYDNFKSFLIALFAYLLVIFVLLYQISKPQEKFKKYTDNPNDYMDVTFDFEIDDKLPSAPEIAKETKQGEFENKNIKDVPEDKIKTTAQVVPPPPVQAKPKEPEKPKEEPKPEPKKDEPKAEPKKEEPKPEPKLEDKPSEKVVEKKEETKPEPKKEEKPSLSDLFGGIDMKKVEQSAKASDAVQSNKKSDKETATSSAKDKAASKNAVVKSDKLGGRTQRTGEYNAYYGAIEKKLQVLWSRYVATAKDDARIKIVFGADGRVADYTIIELGRETEFNQKLRDFLDNLSTQTFPKSPDGASHEIDTRMSDVMKTN